MNLKKCQISLFRFLGLIAIVILLSESFLLGSSFSGKTFVIPERTVELHEKNPLMVGKQKTDLSITLDFIVDGSPSQIYNLWTTISEIKKFFGTDAVVDLRLGGAYEIYFLPRNDPNSDINSTKGARILDLKKDEKLAFEWMMPPFASELNTMPLPTWIEITFQAVKNKPDKTHISLKHYGFKKGEKWNKAYPFFVRNWALILFRLDLLCTTYLSK